jgi:hypothetical protein
VPGFIDAMLADWYTPSERDRFLAGLRELDARAEQVQRRRFALCSEERQTALLADLDRDVATRQSGAAGAAPARESTDEHWFAMLKFLTVWGYCTSEVVMTDALHTYPLPGRFDGCAPLQSTSPAGRNG